MWLVFGTRRNPFVKQFFLTRRQHLFGGRRRHHFFGVLRHDPVDHTAFARLPGNDRFHGSCCIGAIQSQISLARGTVGTVTGKTVVCQDRPDIPVVDDRTVLSRQSATETNHRQRERHQFTAKFCESIHGVLSSFAIFTIC